MKAQDVYDALREGEKHMKRKWRCSTGIKKATYDSLHSFYRDMLSTKCNEDLQYRYGLTIGYLIGSSNLMSGELSSKFLSVIFRAYDRKKKELAGGDVVMVQNGKNNYHINNVGTLNL